MNPLRGAPITISSTFILATCMTAVGWAGNRLVGALGSNESTKATLDENKAFRDRTIANRDRENDALALRMSVIEQRQYEILAKLLELQQHKK